MLTHTFTLTRTLTHTLMHTRTCVRGLDCLEHRSAMSKRTSVVETPRNVDFMLAQQRALMQQPGWKPEEVLEEDPDEKTASTPPTQRRRGMYAK